MDIGWQTGEPHGLGAGRGMGPQHWTTSQPDCQLLARWQRHRVEEGRDRGGDMDTSGDGGDIVIIKGLCSPVWV